MIAVRTPSRIHAGLIHVPGSQSGALERNFGGVGWMIDEPGWQLQFELAVEDAVLGEAAERIAGIRDALRASGHIPADAVRIAVRAAIPAHAGLGSGTQLSLAVADGLFRLFDRPLPPLAELAPLLGRGRRSGIGLHGYFHGGLLIDAGKAPEAPLAAIAARYDFPADWPIVLLQPPGETTWHNDRELHAFAQLEGSSAGAAQRLHDLVRQGIQPGIERKDHALFASALHDFNRLAGEPFARVQGGPYASPAIADWMQRLQSWHCHGCAQSSWGPTIAVVLPDAERAEWLVNQLVHSVPHRIVNGWNGQPQT